MATKAGKLDKKVLPLRPCFNLCIAVLCLIYRHNANVMSVHEVYECVSFASCLVVVDGGLQPLLGDDSSRFCV